METNAFTGAVKSIVDQRLMDAHTNYLGSIVSLDINKATIQPLNMVKIYGQKAQKSAVISDVPVLMPYKYVYTVNKQTKEVLNIEQKELEEGDTVFCGVCDRDITEAKKGSIAATSNRHHSLSDSVVIMGLSEVIYVAGE